MAETLQTIKFVKFINFIKFVKCIKFKVSAFPLRWKARLCIKFIKFWRYREVYKLYKL